MMRSLTRFAVSFTVVLGCMITVASAQTPQATATPKKSTGATVTGKVTIKGKATPGVVVGMRISPPTNPGEPTFKGTTDQEGRYRIVDVPPGSYDVMPIAPAYVIANTVFGRGKSVVLAESEVADEIDFSMVRGGVITGKITDADGRPLIEQRVTLMSADPQKPVQGPANFQFNGVQTDDRGIYRMFGLAAGRYKVFAGQGEDSFFMTVGGRPLYKQTFHPDVTDVNKATVIEVNEGSEAANIDIVLGRAAQTFSASGRVINGENGQPVARVMFSLQLIMDGGRRQFMGSTSTSNAKGEFKLEGLAPGKYVVSLMPQRDLNLRAEPLNFEVADQDVTELAIKTSPGISMAGTVVLENTEDKTVYAKLLQMSLIGFVRSDTAAGSMGHSARINPDGTFLMTGLEPGMASISLDSFQDRALAKGFSISRTERDGVVQTRGVELKNGDQVTGVKVVISYGTAIVRGLVKVENGTLPADARFFLQILRRGERIPGFRPPAVDARGHFLIDGMPGGDYEFTVTVMTGPPGPSVSPTRARQQINVVDGIVNDVTIVVDLSKKPEAPLQ